MPKENATAAPNGPARSKKQLPRWVWLALFAATLAVNIVIYPPSPSPVRVETPYSSFLDELRAGNVAKVELRGDEIIGELKEAKALPIVATVTAPPQTSQPEANFKTTRPPVVDPRLLLLLEEQRVPITAVVPSTPWFVELIARLLPFVFLVGIFVLISRQMGGGGGVFGIGRSKARVYSNERTANTFVDVAGQDQAKNELAEVVDFLKRPDRYLKLGARIPRGVLLSGPPGTGKTLLARAVAGEANVPFYYVNGSEFVEMIVGVGASRVRDLFAKAKASGPCLIFIDEIDAIGRTRGGNIISGHDEREQTLNQLLVEMDGFDRTTAVIVIAATNRPDVLDPALLRAGRFDRHVAVDLPDRVGREGILRIHTRGMPLGQDIDLTTIARATPGFSGADLANLANEAALSASRKHAEALSMDDFELALDRIVLGAERRGIMDGAERRLVAYHEAGHAVVAMLTPGADPVHKVTIIPRGRSLGVTEQLPENDRTNYSRTFLLGRLAVLLGGRTAEEIAVGDISTGAENDIREAVRLAQAMVGRWGMSPSLGFAYVYGQSHGLALSDDRPQPSEATIAQMDAEVRALLDERHATARDILTAHRTALDAVAEALLQEETIDRDRIVALLGGVRTGSGHPAIAVTDTQEISAEVAATDDGDATAAVAA